MKVISGVPLPETRTRVKNSKWRSNVLMPFFHYFYAAFRTAMITPIFIYQSAVKIRHIHIFTVVYSSIMVNSKLAH